MSVPTPPLPFVALVSLGLVVRIVYTLHIVPYVSSHLQAYLQQVQDLVILESIILQTLGKFIFL